jgi:hypothetical protein
LRKGPDRRCVVEDEDKVCEFEADLSTKAAADGPDGGGGGPRSVGETSDYDAGTEAGCAEEASLEDGEDGETLDLLRQPLLLLATPCRAHRQQACGLPLRFPESAAV